MPRGKVVHESLRGILFADCHKITSVGDIIGRQIDAYTGGLKGAAAGISLFRIIPQYTEVGHIRSGGKSLGDRINQSQSAFCRYLIEKRSQGTLERCFPSEFLARIVRHAVAQ